MEFRPATLLIFGIFLSACSVQSSNSTVPLIGTCDEFSYNEKASTRAYVIIPIRGEIMSSTSEVRIELKSNLTILGYPSFACKGQQEKTDIQNVVEVDLKCGPGPGPLGSAFINLVPDKFGLGNGQFSLFNGTSGTFQFGHNLLLTSKS